MCPVHAGRFWRGCVSGDSLCDPYDQPGLSAFEIGQTEFTRAAYAACVDDGACNVPTCSRDPDV